MSGSRNDGSDAELVQVNVASPAGAYTVGSASFFRYILRLGELGLPLSIDDREAIDILGAVPHAFASDDDVGLASGRGWRVVPAQGDLDWPVLEATPRRLHSALERARSLLWTHAARFAVSAVEIAVIEEELDAVYGVLMRAEAAGVAVNVSYVV
ncbi:MAG: hypothetical protein JO078_05395 [Candidatus Eremiobacteraeota bacterium]|nr:hypothetical protein [Candidatus Eremiobacteraeota bacterium]MBV9057308.1 hypothetical protein [Candidatus Eremiobacteraeota bacterium]MBV9699542.1 hypothetical protein [Candidatus Eremiobacteraeota bacterium]